MKKILLIFITYLTAGCSTFDPSNIAPAYQNAFKAMQNSIFGYETNFISPELIREIPYASSIVKIGNGPEGLMILESKEKEITTWVTADNIYLQLRKGKIIKTNGLSNNITNLTMPHFLSSSNFLNTSKELKYKFYYSYDVPFLANLEVNAQYEIIGNEKIKLLGEERELTLVQEKIFSKAVAWKEVNKYWLDQSGYVWKSEQFISPRLPKITIEVTKKPS